MMIVLLFSITVTMLCCYSVSLMLATKDKNARHNIYITLYHTDNKALKKPLTIHAHQTSLSRTRKVNKDFTETNNFYPIMPNNKYNLQPLDIRV